MKALVISKTEIAFNNIVDKQPFIGVAVGTLFTAVIQSSSVTTSLMVPMASAGLLTLETIYFISLGANIGTTVTALMASLAGNKFGLTIALVHSFFNIIG